jgi:hypothetical protein
MAWHHTLFNIIQPPDESEWVFIQPMHSWYINDDISKLLLRRGRGAHNKFRCCWCLVINFPCSDSGCQPVVPVLILPRLIPTIASATRVKGLLVCLGKFGHILNPLLIDALTETDQDQYSHLNDLEFYA